MVLEWPDDLKCLSLRAVVSVGPWLEVSWGLLSEMLVLLLVVSWASSRTVAGFQEEMFRGDAPQSISAHQASAHIMPATVPLAKAKGVDLGWPQPTVACSGASVPSQRLGWVAVVKAPDPSHWTSSQ